MIDCSKLRSVNRIICKFSRFRDFQVLKELLYFVLILYKHGHIGSRHLHRSQHELDECATQYGYIHHGLVTDKLTKISDHIYCCRSGSAADTQAIADIVTYHLNFHKMELGEPPLVQTAAAIFRELCYNYRDSLVAGILVAGWDKNKGGQIYSVPIGGHGSKTGSVDRRLRIVICLWLCRC
ncbi:unnamed protein product [Leptosia nina]|uniref:Uncharacterized protein n=1 Tax=Leptosia nina TaxID=320188 RepID=A0AAV1JH51_9NEOP